MPPSWPGLIRGGVGSVQAILTLTPSETPQPAGPRWPERRGWAGGIQLRRGPDAAFASCLRVHETSVWALPGIQMSPDSLGVGTVFIHPSAFVEC